MTKGAKNEIDQSARARTTAAAAAAAAVVVGKEFGKERLRSPYVCFHSRSNELFGYIVLCAVE